MFLVCLVCVEGAQSRLAVQTSTAITRMSRCQLCGSRLRSLREKSGYESIIDASLNAKNTKTHQGKVSTYSGALPFRGFDTTLVMGNATLCALRSMAEWEVGMLERRLAGEG
jgi:hypothetical protein